MEVLSSNPFQSITVEGKLTPTITVIDTNPDHFPALQRAFDTGETVSGDFYSEPFTGRVTQIAFVDHAITRKPQCNYVISLDPK